MSEPFIGEIKMVGFNFAPRGWARCDGQLLPISSNTALFSLLGTNYGGNGENTFALPELRGRVPVHMGTGPALSPRQLGQRSGVEKVTLSIYEMPSHTHTGGTIPVTDAVGNQTVPDGHILARANDGESNYSDAAANGVLGGVPGIGNSGGSQSHENMPPFLAINFVIALQGIFPSPS
jgi:microcystin-dependent protein